MPFFSWRGKGKDGAPELEGKGQQPHTTQSSRASPASRLTRSSLSKELKESSVGLGSGVNLPRISSIAGLQEHGEEKSQDDAFAAGSCAGIIAEARKEASQLTSPTRGPTSPNMMQKQAATAHVAAPIPALPVRTGRSSLESARVDIASSSLFATAATQSPQGARARRFSANGSMLEDQVMPPNQLVKPRAGDGHRSDSVGRAPEGSMPHSDAPHAVASNQTLTCMRNSAFASGYSTESRDFSTQFSHLEEPQSPKGRHNASPSRMSQEGNRPDSSRRSMQAMAVANAMVLADSQRTRSPATGARKSLEDAIRMRQSIEMEGGRFGSATTISSPRGPPRPAQHAVPSGGGGDSAIAAAIAASEALTQFNSRGAPKPGPSLKNNRVSHEGDVSNQHVAGTSSLFTPSPPPQVAKPPADAMVPAPPPKISTASLVVPKPKLDPVRILGCQPHPEHTAALPGYSVGEVVGEGGFCQVRLGVHHVSQRKVAIKIVDKSKLTDPNEAKRMQREIRVMRHLNSCESVIKLFEVVDSTKLLYLIMEYAPAGSLLDFVRGCKRLSEQDAAYILQQIVHGLIYCHKREVVHRDIKLENILLDAKRQMKLIDFGLSAFYIPGHLLKVHCGSPSYAAPEIVARKHYDGPPVDVWSTGVVLYAMLCGFLPFHASGGDKHELCEKIMDGKYNVPDWLSPNAIDLLQRMLTVDPTQRITLEEIMQHPWVRASPVWEALGATVYSVRVDPKTGGVQADEMLLQEMELAGYARANVLQSLLAEEANYVTASYYLLAEGKAEVLRRMRCNGPARRVR